MHAEIVPEKVLTWPRDAVCVVCGGGDAHELVDVDVKLV